MKLDALSESEAKLILAIGNDNANAIWEEGVESQKGWEKPDVSSGRKAKEEWIKSKYLWRGFLKISDEDGKTREEREEKSSKDSYEAAKHGDVLGVARALAHGAVATWKNEDDGNKTALHACTQLKDENTEDVISQLMAPGLLQFPPLPPFMTSDQKLHSTDMDICKPCSDDDTVETENTDSNHRDTLEW